MLHVNVHFWNKWCGKTSHQHSQLRDRGVNKQRGEKSGAKQHCAKAGASTCVIIFTASSCTLAFAEQQTDHTTGTLSSSSLSTSSSSLSRLVMTSTSACLVSQKDGDLWECFGDKRKINVDMDSTLIIVDMKGRFVSTALKSLSRRKANTINLCFGNLWANNQTWRWSFRMQLGRRS